MMKEGYSDGSDEPSQDQLIRTQILQWKIAIASYKH